MRMLGKAIGAIVMAGTLAGAFATGASAQRHARDSRQYFDYGDPLMSSVLQSPDGKAVEVRAYLTRSEALRAVGLET